jgi:hypothetical protein
MTAREAGRVIVPPFPSRPGGLLLRPMTPPPDFTPQDFATLAAFLYGPAWYARLPDDSALRGDNLRRLVDGRRNVPPAVAEFMLRRAADRWLLRGWADQRPPPGLSPAVAAELDARILDARRWSDASRPGTPPATNEEPTS